MKCIVCDKEATYTAYGNSYCKKCYRLSPYWQEIQAKKRLYAEKKEKAKEK